MSNSVIDELHVIQREAKARVETYNSLVRLLHNRDFITVIQKGYLENQAIELVHLKASPGKQSAEAQAEIIRRIDSIGLLRNYLLQVEQTADEATKSINEIEQTLEELRSEEL